jgi:hypothetical protein
MGRPIKKSYFKNKDNTPFPGSSVSTLTFSNTGAGYFAANVAITLSAPQLPASVQATISNIALNGNGAITTYTINGGQGYTSAPLVTITGANTTPAVATSTITTTVGGSTKIAISAWIPTINGGVSAKVAEIFKQESSRRYRVITTDGTGPVRLTAPAYLGWNAGITAGFATIAATDSVGGTYYIVKLTQQRAIVVQNSGTQIESGTAVKWALTGSAVAATSTSLAMVLIASM